MVDVGDKPVTQRTATASGRVEMAPATLQRILERGIGKGDVLAVARLAGIMAAKRTADLVPLCHPLPLTSVTVELAPDETASAVAIRATCRVTGRTGVEMEALTAVSVAALTVYDMCKAIDRDMRITAIRLEHKAGGRSGEFRAAR
jgi:cyclic pyranopterin phosphate synthase